MKRRIVYCCDYCSFESHDLAEMEAHEAAHFGLSVSEYHEWKFLQKSVQSNGAAISISKNDTTEKNFDDAIRLLMEFEKKHEISDKETHGK